MLFEMEMLQLGSMQYNPKERIKWVYSDPCLSLIMCYELEVLDMQGAFLQTELYKLIASCEIRRPRYTDRVKPIPNK